MEYGKTSDYYWPLIGSGDQTGMVNGKEVESTAGPFGFKEAIMLKKDHCIVKSSFVRKKDKCILNPIDCSNGLSFSIWEKVVYNEDIFDIERDHDRKYLLSNGGQHFKEKTTPGFSLYKIGMDIVAVVSTGKDVWELKIRGQLNNQTWVNIGVIWEQLESKNKSYTGGLSVSTIRYSHF